MFKLLQAGRARLVSSGKLAWEPAARIAAAAAAGDSQTIWRQARACATNVCKPRSEANIEAIELSLCDSL